MCSLGHVLSKIFAEGRNGTVSTGGVYRLSVTRVEESGAMWQMV